MPLRPRKKQTFAIEWESSLNTAAQCAALVRGWFSFVCRFHEKKTKKIIVFLMGKSHFGLYILALSLFGKEVGSMYIFLWMDCLQDWFDASMNILNGMKKKKVFPLTWNNIFLVIYIISIYIILVHWYFDKKYWLAIWKNKSLLLRWYTFVFPF